jgi:signal transduction histidine kinase
MLLVHVFPGFHFLGVLPFLLILGVALTWGLGPAVLATVLGALLQGALVLEVPLSADSADLVGTSLILIAGGATSIVASQAERRRRLLAAERAQLAAIVDLLPDPLSVWNMRGMADRVNRAGMAASELRPGTSLDGLARMVSMRTVEGAPVPIEAFPVVRALRGELVDRDEVRLSYSGAPERRLLVQAAPIHDARGETVGAVTISHDFTALRLAEEAATRQASELQAVFEAMTEGIAVYDLDGRLVRMNGALRRLLGVDARPEYVSLPLEERLALLSMRDSNGEPIGREQWLNRQLLRGEPSDADGMQELQMRSLDGRDLRLNMSGSPIHDARGEVIGAVLVLRDVTEHWLLERNVKLERDRLQQVLDVFPEAVLICDSTPAFLMSNNAATQILGFDPVGQPVPEAEPAAYEMFGARRLDGSSYPAADLPINRAMHQGEIVRAEQLLVRNAISGADVPVLSNSAPLTDPSGVVLGAMMVFQDISAIRELERQKDTFLATVSHDLKNPLTAIHGMGQLLVRRARRGIGQDQLMQGLESIVHASDQMARQITELLDTSRLQLARPLDLDMRLVDLVPLIQKIADDYAQSSDQHAIRFETDQTTLQCPCDSLRLERALANLLSNALKYSPDGGDVVLTLRRATVETEDSAVITVRDHGIGIPANELPRVFEQFFRASNVTDNIGGTGIGLAGVRQIIRQHGGTIDMESEEGAGTTVTVTLRLAEAPDEDTLKSAALQPYPSLDRH